MKNIVITGASEGIGKAIALRLAQEEAKLFLLARNGEALNEVVSEVEEAGGKASAVVCDITDTAALKTALESIGTSEGIDVLINNAGVWQKMSDLDVVSDEDVSTILNTNLTGHIFATKYCLPFLRKSASPALINIISKSGVTAQLGQSIYTASKWGMRGFTEVLRGDLKETNIRIAAVYQAGTATNMFSKTGEEMPEEKFTPPEDLAETIAFMLTRPDKIWLNEVHVTY